jgi:hypothetical protein
MKTFIAYENNDASLRLCFEPSAIGSRRRMECFLADGAPKSAGLGFAGAIENALDEVIEVFPEFHTKTVAACFNGGHDWLNGRLRTDKLVLPKALRKLESIMLVGKG